MSPVIDDLVREPIVDSLAIGLKLLVLFRLVNDDQRVVSIASR